MSHHFFDSQDIFDFQKNYHNFKKHWKLGGGGWVDKEKEVIFVMFFWLDFGEPE